MIASNKGFYKTNQKNNLATIFVFHDIIIGFHENKFRIDIPCSTYF